MDKIADGRGSRYEVNDLMRLADFMRKTAHCGLGEDRGQSRCAIPGSNSARPSSGASCRDDFAPAVDLDKALEPTRKSPVATTPAAHIVAEPEHG